MDERAAKTLLRDRLIEYGRRDLARQPIDDLKPLDLIHACAAVYRVEGERPLVVQLAMEILFQDYDHTPTKRWTTDAIETLRTDVFGRELMRGRDDSDY